MRQLFGDHASLAASIRSIENLANAHGTGVVCEVALQSIAFDGSAGAVRQLSGMWYLALNVDVDGSSITLHGVLSQEGPAGLQTFAGEIVDAQCVLLTIQAQQVEHTRAAMPVAPLPASPAPAPMHPAKPVHMHSAPIPAESSARLRPEASAPTITGATGATGIAGVHAMPQRPRRAEPDFNDALTPEAGDFVEHFAFGRCEVVKSDGERLHVRLPKETRTKEIAIAMLRVTRLEDSAEKRVFRLDRKM